MSGTTATVVYYGIKILRPEILLPHHGDRLSRRRPGHRQLLDNRGHRRRGIRRHGPDPRCEPEITAGSVISGAYLGDKLTPLSETTILVPKLVGGVEIYQHIRAMLWTTVPAFLIALVLFAILALNEDTQDIGQREGQQRSTRSSRHSRSRSSTCFRCCSSIFLSLRRFPPFLSILAARCSPGSWRRLPNPMPCARWPMTQSSASEWPRSRRSTQPWQPVSCSDTGIGPVDSLFSRGGMASMLTTIWLVLGALSFAAVMEYAGFLDRLIQPIIALGRIRPRDLLIAVGATAIGLNVIAGDQYVADRAAGQELPSRVSAPAHSAPGALAHRRGHGHGHLACSCPGIAAAPT